MSHITCKHCCGSGKVKHDDFNPTQSNCPHCEGEGVMGTFNCPVCGKDTPHHHHGVWTLTAPDGRQWRGDSPIKACREEQRSRIPDSLAVERVMQIATQAEAEAPPQSADDQTHE